MNVAQKPDSQPLVRFNHVDKYFGDLRVLNDLNLAVAPAEKLAIIGPSGSGKSTVLRALMTLEKINSGTIEVEGELLTHIHKNGQLVTAPEKHIRHGVSELQSVSAYDRYEKRHRSADQSVGLIESGSGRTRRQFAANGRVDG